jgi:predicted permease
VLARKDLFPQAASKGVSQVTMNIALPALIFSNIVPAFTPSNVSAIGPLALIAVVYVLLGFLFGYLIREVCYVPRNFWQGIIVATGLSNWGNLRELLSSKLYDAISNTLQLMQLYCLLQRKVRSIQP